jgi:hypothetical protein
MTVSPTSEKYTPEQRKLLGQAYRMILGWGMRRALVHKSRSRQNSSVCLAWLGNLVRLRHTQMGDSVESGAPN